ncbi:MAG: epoxyqueuosine reductase QueH [Butyrivibrio sp.]|nr:epoxyqueuosine reductase QueH [Butyrivibrio sp.]
MNKRNFQKELDKIIDGQIQEDTVPRLLLHSCCAPCSSYVLKYLAEYFSITVLYYNPNISPGEEYTKRVEEQRRLIEEMPVKNSITLIACDYEPQEFYDAVRGLEKEPEGGARCFVCYELRMREAAMYAAEYGFDYFTTTLSISPLKNAEKINEIGEKLSAEYGVKHLPSDFKKREGYKQSVELSAQYNLYRQNYCGCIFSKGEQK